MKKIKMLLLLGCMLSATSSFGQTLDALLKKSDQQALSKSDISKINSFGKSVSHRKSVRDKIKFILSLPSPRGDQLNLVENVLIPWLGNPKDLIERLRLVKEVTIPAPPQIKKVPLTTPPITPATLKGAKEKLRNLKSELKEVDSKVVELSKVKGKEWLDAKEELSEEIEGIKEKLSSIEKQPLGELKIEEQKQLKDELKNLDTEVKQVEVKRVRAAIKYAEEQQKDVAQKIEGFVIQTADLERIEKKDIKKRRKAIKEEAEKIEATLENAQDTLESLKKEVEIAENINAQIEKLKEEQKRLEKKAEDARVKLAEEELARVTELLEKEIKDLEDAVKRKEAKDRLEQQRREAEELSKEVEGIASEWERELEEIESEKGRAKIEEEINKAKERTDAALEKLVNVGKLVKPLKEIVPPKPGMAEKPTGIFEDLTLKEKLAQVQKDLVIEDEFTKLAEEEIKKLQTKAEFTKLAEEEIRKLQKAKDLEEFKKLTKDLIEKKRSEIEKTLSESLLLKNVKKSISQASDRATSAEVALDEVKKAAKEDKSLKMLGAVGGVNDLRKVLAEKVIKSIEDLNDDAQIVKLIQNYGDMSTVQKIKKDIANLKKNIKDVLIQLQGFKDYPNANKAMKGLAEVEKQLKIPNYLE